MKKYKVSFTVASTHTTVVLAEDEDHALELVNDGKYDESTSDGWEEISEAWEAEEVEDEL